MEKYAWKAKIKAGKKLEYKKRHDEIWPELVALLKEAGINNYSIWCEGDLLFGYYECEKGIDYALEKQKQSPIVAKWNNYMKDVLEMEMEDSGGQPHLEQIFDLK